MVQRWDRIPIKILQVCIQGFCQCSVLKNKIGKNLETIRRKQVFYSKYSTLMDIEQTQSYKRAHTEGKDI